MFLLVKIMTQMNTFTLVFYRSIVQICISLVDLYKKRVNPLGPNDIKIRFYLVVRGVLGAAAVMAWFFGIQILPLPTAVTLQFTTPVFAAIFAVCLVGEKWKRMDIIGSVVCVTGISLIANASSGSEEEVVVDDTSTLLKALAVIITTLGSVCAGVAYVSVRLIGDEVDAVVMVFYYGTLSLPMCAIGSKIYLGDWNILGNFETFSIRDYILLLLVGFGGYGGQWFTNMGLQIETAATATLAMSTQIVWSFIFEFLFLHESINMWSLSGTVLILGYMIIIGIVKVIESDSGYRTKQIDVEEGIDDEGVLLEPKPIDYGSTSQTAAAQ